MPPGKSGKFLDFLLENDFGPGKSWNLLGNDADGSFCLQIDMFLQPQITVTVATRYVFWAAGMPKMLSPKPSSCWLTTGSSKNVPWVAESRGKILECFVTKRVGTLIEYL